MHSISRNRHLPWQGIRSGGKLVSIELDQIYVTLRATRERTVSIEDEWLKSGRAVILLITHCHHIDKLGYTVIGPQLTVREMIMIDERKTKAQLIAESNLAFEQFQTNEYIRFEDLPLETRDG